MHLRACSVKAGFDAFERRADFRARAPDHAHDHADFLHVQSHVLDCARHDYAGVYRSLPGIRYCVEGRPRGHRA